MTAAPIFPWSDGTSATVRMVLGTGIGTIRMHGPTGSARTATLTMRTDGGVSDAGGSVTVVAMMTTSTGGDMSAEMTVTSGTAYDLKSPRRRLRSPPAWLIPLHPCLLLASANVQVVMEHIAQCPCLDSPSVSLHVRLAEVRLSKCKVEELARAVLEQTGGLACGQTLARRTGALHPLPGLHFGAPGRTGSRPIHFRP